MSTDINSRGYCSGDMNGHVGQVANGFHEAQWKLWLWYKKCRR